MRPQLRAVFAFDPTRGSEEQEHDKTLVFHPSAPVEEQKKRVGVTEALGQFIGGNEEETVIETEASVQAVVHVEESVFFSMIVNRGDQIVCSQVLVSILHNTYASYRLAYGPLTTARLDENIDEVRNNLAKFIPAIMQSIRFDRIHQYTDIRGVRRCQLPSTPALHTEMLLQRFNDTHTKFKRQCLVYKGSIVSSSFNPVDTQVFFGICQEQAQQVMDLIQQRQTRHQVTLNRTSDTVQSVESSDEAIHLPALHTIDQEPQHLAVLRYKTMTLFVESSSSIMAERVLRRDFGVLFRQLRDVLDHMDRPSLLPHRFLLYDKREHTVMSQLASAKRRLSSETIRRIVQCRSRVSLHARQSNPIREVLYLSKHEGWIMLFVSPHLQRQCILLVPSPSVRLPETDCTFSSYLTDPCSTHETFDPAYRVSLFDALNKKVMAEPTNGEETRRLVRWMMEKRQLYAPSSSYTAENRTTASLVVVAPPSTTWKVGVETCMQMYPTTMRFKRVHQTNLETWKDRSVLLDEYRQQCASTTTFLDLSKDDNVMTTVDTFWESRATPLIFVWMTKKHELSTTLAKAAETLNVGMHVLVCLTHAEKKAESNRFDFKTVYDDADDLWQRLKQLLQSHLRMLNLSKRESEDVHRHLLSIIRKYRKDGDRVVYSKFVEYIDDFRSSQPSRGNSTGRALARADEISTCVPHLESIHSLLDLGCAEGNITSALGKRFGVEPQHTHGCDVREITEDDGTWVFRRMEDGGVLPYDDNSFDCICVLMVLHHIEPDRLSLLLEELYRVVKPSGYIVIREHDCCVPRLESVLDIMHGLYALVWADPPEMPLTRFVECYTAHYRSKQQWTKLLEEHGLRLALETEPSRRLYECKVTSGTPRSPYVRNPFRYYYGVYQKRLS